MEITEINNTKENITDLPNSGNVGSNNTISTSTSDEVGVSYKYVASIDVGIKNLALCVFQINVSSDSSFPSNKCDIVHWDVINLCNDENKVKYCDHCKFQAVYEKCIVSSPFKDSMENEVEDYAGEYEYEYEYFCRRHSKCMDIAGLPPIPGHLEPNVLKKCKYNELVKLCEEENIPLEKEKNKKLSKTQLLSKIQEYCDKTYLNIVTKHKVNAKDISLIDIGTQLVVAFDKIKNIMNLQHTTVLIENQISPLANRMKTIQGMITQYFIMNQVDDVVFVSSINKLKDFVTNSGDYNDRKKMGVCICKDIVMSNESFSKNAELLEKSKKKDDMADSFLQGLWYLRKYGFFELDSAIYSS
jgi:hypothetical protein